MSGGFLCSSTQTGSFPLPFVHSFVEPLMLERELTLLPCSGCNSPWLSTSDFVLYRWLLFHNDTTIPSTFTSLNDQGDGGVLASSPSSTQSPTGLSRGAGDVQGRGMGEFTEWQVRRAAWLVGRFLDFKQRLERSVRSSSPPSKTRLH
jgi:hypothetical protein